MKYIFTICLFIVAPFTLYSQLVNNQLLGFQQPFTQIKAQATDEDNNVYYAGNFKGRLVLGKEFEIDGRGGQDIFIVKLNSYGEIIWVRIYGDSTNQGCNDLVFYKGDLFLAFRQSGNAEIEGNPINAYNSGREFTAVCRIDSSNGDIQWIKRASVSETKLVAGNNTILLYGLSPANTGDIFLGDTKVLNSSTLNQEIFFYLHTNGTLHGAKVVSTTPTIYSSANWLTPYYAESGSLFFLVHMQGATNYKLGMNSLTFSSSGSYCAIVKTDTSLFNFSYKILNPSLSTYMMNVFSDSAGFTVSSKGDSLYMVLGGTSDSSGVFDSDGLSMDIKGQSVLLVMDTNLISRRLQPLNKHLLGGSALCVRIRQLLVKNDLYFIYGEFRGLNNVPVSGIPVNRQTFSIINNGPRDSLDLNGSTRIFLARCKNNLEEAQHKWIGDLSINESNSALPGYFTIQNNRLYFLHRIDNLWNPWITDTTLTILKGSIIANADRSDMIRYIKYLSDGSRFIVGLAKGRTAFDPSDTLLISDAIKSDLFIARLDAQNNPIWYKRFSHSFGNLSVGQIVYLKNKLYLSLQLSLPRNNGSNNFIRIDNTPEFVTPGIPQTMVLLSIDSNAYFKHIPLSAPFNSSSVFDVSDNETLLITSSLTTTDLSSSPKYYGSTQGFYVARTDTTGNILDLVKFYAWGSGSTVSAPVRIISNKDNGGFLLQIPQAFTPTLLSNTFYYTNGFPGPATITLTAPVAPTVPGSTMYMGIITANFSSFNPPHIAGPANSYNRTEAVDTNRHFLLIGRTGSSSAFYYDKQVLANNTEPYLRMLLQTDNAGNLVRYKLISKDNTTPASLNISALSFNGKTLLASGSIYNSVNVDTIQTGHSGLSDAITFELDTLLQAKRIYRIASKYNETMYGADIFKDSIISFAYTAQEEVSLYNYKVNGLRVSSGLTTYKDENAFVCTSLLKPGTITSVTDINQSKGNFVYPNPLQGTILWISLNNYKKGLKKWNIYNLNGQLLLTGKFIWLPETTISIHFAQKLTAGCYLLQIIGDPSEKSTSLKVLVQ